MIVDITVGIFTQIGFTLLGLALLVRATGRTSFIGPTLFGALVAVLALAGFYLVQRLGLFRFVGVIISRLANSPDWHSLVQSGEKLDAAVRALYARRATAMLDPIVATGWEMLIGGGVFLVIAALAGDIDSATGDWTEVHDQLVYLTVDGC